MDPKSLDSEINRLKLELAVKNESCEKAAQFGMDLLTSNEELNANIQSLKQENHTLQKQISNSLQSEKFLTDEIESLKESYQHQLKEHEDELNLENLTLSRKLTELQNDLDEQKLVSEQKDDMIKDLQASLVESQHCLKTPIRQQNEAEHEELTDLYDQIKNLNEEKVEQLHLVKNLRNSVELEKLHVKQLTDEINEIKSENNELKSQITAYYKSTQELREELQEYKIQIDLLKVGNQKQRRHGNSLFSEVEDERLKAEEELSSALHQVEELKKQNQLNIELQQKLKIHLAEMLQHPEGKAMNEYVTNLRQQLVQARGEIQTLNTCLKKEQNRSPVDYENEFEKTYCNTKDETNFIEFLKALIVNKDKEIEALKKEHQTLRFVSVSENATAIENRREIFTLKKKLEHQKSANIKLEVQLEELLIKYEPEKVLKRKKSKEKEDSKLTDSTPTEEVKGTQKPASNKDCSNSSFIPKKCLNSKENEQQHIVLERKLRLREASRCSIVEETSDKNECKTQ